MLNKNIILITILIVILAIGVTAAPQKTIIDEIGLPSIPGSRITMEANIPQGKLMDSIAKEYGSWLGLSDLKQVGIITLSVDQNTQSQRLLEYYDQTFSKPGWKTIAKSLDKNTAMAIEYSETNGMIVINVDAPGKKNRQLTIIRIIGKLDPDKLSRSERTLPDRIRQWINGPFGPEGESGIPETVARISPGRQISIPPAKWLQVKTLRSKVRAYIKPQNTVMIDAYDKSDYYGELVRTNTGIVLSTSPQLQITGLQLPSSTPTILQITEGTLTLAGSSNTSDKINKLEIIATNAPVTINSYSMIAGTVTIKSIGGLTEIVLSEVSGGNLEATTTGNDIVLTIPKNASVNIEAASTSGKVHNLTGIEPVQSSVNFAKIAIGDKKAAISLQAINGNITIKQID